MPTMTVDDVDSFYKEAHEDYIGLWQIVRRANRRLSSSEAVREASFDVVTALVARGLRVGNLTKDGSFIPWNEQSSEAIIERMRKEWIELGHAPTIDDIAWLELPR